MNRVFLKWSCCWQHVQLLPNRFFGTWHNIPLCAWDDSVIPLLVSIQITKESLLAHVPLDQPAYTTAPATPDPSRVCDLHHSSRQRRIFNPLSKARDLTWNLMDPSRIRFHCATIGTPEKMEFYNFHRVFMGLDPCLRNINLALTLISA